MAYEWEFCGLNDYSKKIEIPPQEGETDPTFIVDEGTMTEAQQKMAEELKSWSWSERHGGKCTGTG